MSRFLCIILLLLFVADVTAQRELINARDPASLRSEVIHITHFNLPGAVSAYAGVRFIDARSIRGFCGFVKPAVNSPARKITTTLPFEEELNGAVKIREREAVAADTALVLLRHFWLYRSLSDQSLMYCHVKAMLFRRSADSVYYVGKLDTILSRKGVIKVEFKDMPALFVEDMLRVLRTTAGPDSKVYSVTAFQKQAEQTGFKQVALPAGDGILLSAHDFAKGKIYPCNVTMNAFNDQYLLLLSQQEDQLRYENKAWGVIYNGDLYLRNGRHFDKAYRVENSFLVMNNIKNNSGLYAYSYPLVLNMESGRLE